MDVNGEVKLLLKLKKKSVRGEVGGGGGGGGGSKGCQEVDVNVNEGLKFL